MFISLAQRNGTKETSTLSKPSPIWEGLIVEGQLPFYKVLVWLTSLRPYGVSHECFYWVSHGFFLRGNEWLLIDFAIGLSESMDDELYLIGHVGVGAGRGAEGKEFVTETWLAIDVEVEVLEGSLLGLGIGEVEHGELCLAVGADFEIVGFHFFRCCFFVNSLTAFY